MLRYFRLFGYFVRFSLSRSMEFRMDFFFRIVMDCVYYAVNIAFFRLIFLNTGLLGGWDEKQMMVFVGTYLVLDGLKMTLFSNNTWWLPIYVNRGDLDYYLTRPVSTFFFVSLRDFAVNSFINLLFALGILVWALMNYPEALAADRLILYTVLLLNGVWLIHLFHMLTLLPVFWTHSGRGFEQIFWGFSRYVERPDRIFTGWVRRIVTTAVPFALMASFPARILIEGPSFDVVWHTLWVTVIFSGVIGFFWRLGLRSYSSASS